MKKFLCILIALLFASFLVSCKPKEETQEPNNNEELNEPVDTTSFDEYLNKNINSLNIEKFNSLFPRELNTSFISQIKMPNSTCSIEVEKIESLEKYNDTNTFLWQQDQIIYAYCKTEDEQVIKFDLLKIEEALTNGLSEFNSFQLSDVVDLLLSEINGSSEVKLANLLEKINLTSDDFYVKENNVYELKRETISKIIVAITNNRFSPEEALELMDKYVKKLSISLTYDNGKIRNIGIIVEISGLNSAEIKNSLSINLIYNNDDFQGIDFGTNLSVNYYDVKNTDFIINAYGSVFENDFTLNLKLSTKIITEILVSIKDNEYTFNYEEKNEEQKITKNIVCNFTIKEEMIDSFSAVYENKEDKLQQKLSLKLSVDGEIEIPEVDINEAEDIFDLLGDKEIPEEEKE